jgi:hypothetical protein
MALGGACQRISDDIRLPPISRPLVPRHVGECVRFRLASGGECIAKLLDAFVQRPADEARHLVLVAWPLVRYVHTAVEIEKESCAALSSNLFPVSKILRKGDKHVLGIAVLSDPLNAIALHLNAEMILIRVDSAVIHFGVAFSLYCDNIALRYH